MFFCYQAVFVRLFSNNYLIYKKISFLKNILHERCFSIHSPNQSTQFID